MKIKVYMSNISPLWPKERQVALLREKIEGFPKSCDVREDVLSPRERRAHQVASLARRATLFRPTSRMAANEVLVFASPAVATWTETDLLAIMAAAVARGATVRFLDADLEIGPQAGAAEMLAVISAFKIARQRDADIRQGSRGGAVSAKKREDRARAAAETIRAAWAKRDTKTPELLAHADISLNTAKRYLGSRIVAQKARDAAEKRKASYRKAKP
jgi:hypothetical protein